MITDDVESIGARAFYGCDALRVVLIPDSVSSIGEDAFAGCPELTLSVPAGSYAQQYCIDNGLNWKAVLIGDTLVYEVLEDSKLRVDLYTGTGGEAHVPWVFDGYEVSTIGAKAFYGNNSVINVDLPDNITAIEDEAFALCTGLTDIRMPYDLQSIGDHAFQGCSALKSISLPKALRDIGEGAFSYCSTLTSAAVPAGVTKLMPETFADCAAMTSVSLPETLTEIGDAAFSHCLSLPDFTVPASVDYIGFGVFDHCEALTSVVVPEGATFLGTDFLENSPKATVITREDAYAHQFCDIHHIAYALVDAAAPDFQYATQTDGTVRILRYTGSDQGVNIPATLNGKTVSAIGDHAFQDCSGMTGVSIPCGVTSVGNDAFSGCAALKTVFYDGTQEQKAAMQIGSGNEPLLAAAWQLIDHILVLPAGIARIESEAFAGLPEIQGVRIPITVSSIAADAFDHAVVIYAPAGSYAAQWAISNGYELVEE